MEPIEQSPQRAENQSPSPTPPLPEPPYSRRKDPFAEPPVKDFSHLLQPNQRPYAQKSKKRRAVGIMVVVFVLVLVGGGAYYAFDKAKTVQPSSHALSKKVTKGSSVQSISTSSYTSTGFGATFHYPSSWQVIDNGSTSLSIDSPKTLLSSITGQAAEGKIVVSFAAQGQIPAGFGPTAATAVLESQKISYQQPSATQRADTYLSFVQYATTTQTGGLDSIYVTGNYGYQEDQTIPRTDVINFNPMISISFGTCGNTTCTSLTPLTINVANWSTTSFQAPLTTIIKSLVFS